MKTPICSTCNIEMDEGYIPDIGYRTTYHNKWFEGKPEEIKQFLMKEKTLKPTERSEGKNIEAYRCSKCGKIELYAL